MTGDCRSEVLADLGAEDKRRGSNKKILEKHTVRSVDKWLMQMCPSIRGYCLLECLIGLMILGVLAAQAVQSSGQLRERFEFETDLAGVRGILEFAVIGSRFSTEALTLSLVREPAAEKSNSMLSLKNFAQQAIESVRLHRGTTLSEFRFGTFHHEADVAQFRSSGTMTPGRIRLRGSNHQDCLLRLSLRGRVSETCN